MLAVTICLFVALFVIATADVLVRIKAGTHTVALYYPAQLDEAHPVFNETVVETFLELIKPGETRVESVKYNTSLTIRSSDLVTRLRLDFGANKNNTLYPYVVSFKNMHVDDRGGNKPLELQHGGSEYIWIDGGNVITHLTGPIHEFHVKDATKEPLVTVSLWDEKDEL